MPIDDLRRLERIKADFGGAAADAKLSLLRRLERASLPGADRLRRLHEALCFLRAYPDDERVLAQAVRMLDRFDRRRDLARHRDRLADSGIAGTDIRYRFFWSTAQWLAGRWPQHLSFERGDEEAEARLLAALPLIAPPSAAEWLASAKLPAREAIDALRGRRTDAAWFVARVAAMAGDGFTREAFADGIDAPYLLRAGRDTPSRSRAQLAGLRPHFRQSPLDRSRPDLRAAATVAPRGQRQLRGREAAAALDLARAAMVTRSRDLAAFEYADTRDVRLVDDGEGLAFVFNGVIPERRALLAATYGYLMLHNGVPIGYGQVDALGPHAALSFNVFESFRGGETPRLFARLMSATHHLFGARAFSVEPYQLGVGNDEAIATGAWWFYHKLGLRPAAPAALRTMRRELARQRLRPAHRSSVRTLHALAAHHLYFDLDGAAPRGLPPVTGVLERAAGWLARRGGGAEAEAAADQAVRKSLGLRSFKGWSRGERQAWRRWAPLLATLPGIARWSAIERRLLGEVVRAKGGGSELEFLLRFAAHDRLRRALLGASWGRP